ncbi:MAG: substrate-binding domain-containing protein [Solirubrobacterales bacterium]
MSFLVFGSAVALAACGGGSGGSSSGNGEKFTIVMSNGFVSQWRSQMENVAAVMSEQNEPYKGHVEFKKVVSETSPTAQIQSLNNVIAEKPDAILIDALSPTALDPVAEKACAQGILVIFFDQIGQADCAYKLHEPELELFRNNAEWLAKTLHGKGKIIQDLGLAGSPISQQGDKAAEEIFAKYPGIEIVAKYEGNYTPGPTKQAVSQILTTTKGIEGVYGIAGVDGAVQAFEETGTPMVPMTNYGDMSVRLVNLIDKNKPKGLEFSMVQNAPTLGGQALQLAWRLLNEESAFDKEWGFKEGEDEKDILVPAIAYNTNGLPPLPGFEPTTYAELQELAKGLPEEALIPYSLPQSPVPAKPVIGS